MHLETIDEQRIGLLNELKKIDAIKMFSLGGGTGLSLQLGLRTSFDFDFFTDVHFSTDKLLSDLKKVFGDELEIITKEDELATLDLYIKNIKVNFFEYRHKILAKPVPFDGFEPISILSIRDISAMKAIAIIQRGTKKDFFDMYFSIKNLNMSAAELLSLIEAKYQDQNLKIRLLYSLAYFDDAENDVLPLSFVDYSWEEIKKFFIKFAKNVKKELDNGI